MMHTIGYCFFCFFLKPVGRYCEYKNIRGDRSSEFDTFDDYKSSLKLECDEGEAGSFTWTPDENTPDVVYYQVIGGTVS